MFSCALAEVADSSKVIFEFNHSLFGGRMHSVIIPREMRFYGLRRSGNHAIINWVLKQFGDNVRFFNDVHPEQLNALYSQLVYEGSQPALLAFSFEDQPLDRLSPNRTNSSLPSGVRIEKRIHVIILRDPYNLFASRLRKGQDYHEKWYAKVKARLLRVTDLWVMYAEEFLGRTKLLGGNIICVNYNLWCDDAGYREQLAEKFSVKFTDAGYEDVASGPGSSFDRFAFQGKASRMKTNERWIHGLSDQNYLDLFRDRYISKLSEEIFGLTNSQLDFVKNKLEPRFTNKASIVRKIKTVAWLMLSPVYDHLKHNFKFQV